MARYIAKVLIVVEADDHAEAADSISACLTENLKYNDAIVDWSYQRIPASNRYEHARRVRDDVPLDIEDECLTSIYEEAKEE